MVALPSAATQAVKCEPSPTDVQSPENHKEMKLRPQLSMSETYGTPRPGYVNHLTTLINYSI